MDHTGLQSPIKKSPPTFIMYIFLGVHYSAASKTERKYKFFMLKTQQNAPEETKEEYDGWRRDARTSGNVSIRSRKR